MISNHYHHVRNHLANINCLNNIGLTVTIYIYRVINLQIGFLEKGKMFHLYIAAADRKMREKWKEEIRECSYKRFYQPH